MSIFQTIKNKYAKMPLPVKASMWFMAMSILQKGIQFLVTPIYTRLLTTEEYGFYSVYTSWCSILVVIASLNLCSGVFNNGMMKYENDRARFTSSMQGLGNAATIVVFGVLFLFRGKIASVMGSSTYLLLGVFFQIFFCPAFGCWSQYQRYTYSYIPLTIVTMATVCFTPIVSVALIFWLPERKYAVILGNMIVQIGVGIVFYVYNLMKGKTLFVKKYWSFALTFNLPLIPHYLAGIVLGQSDRIMINFYCGEGKAGIYSLTYTLSLMLNIVVTAISSTYAPWTYQQMKQKKYKKISQLSNYILFALGIIVIAGILVAPELIAFLGTEEYMEAKWIVAPVMMSCYFTMVYSLFGNIEFYFEKSVSVMIASVSAAAANIVLNAIFIPIYGYIAAGYTTLICYFLLAVMHFASMKRVCKQNGVLRIYDIKFISVFSVIVCSLSLLAMLTYKFTIVRYLILLVIFVVMVSKKDKIVAIAASIKNQSEAQ